tara:strand:+ start:325 stop:1623 length:1299 start_codon:yes stop_codon:yes gene_type:complete
MARRPFFSGNYGSALGSTANAANLIARAGETQGQMFANMGQQIGGMIQQYGLNKEKQKKNEGFIKSQSSMLDMLAEQDPDMAPQYAAYKENLNNPDVPLSTRVEFGKNLVNNITLSTQLQGQKLMQATQAQSLKEQKNTEILRSDLLEQKKKFNDLGIELKQLEADKGKALSTAEIQNTLAKYGLSGEQIEAERELLPKKTEALGTQLDTNIMQNEARQKIIPGQTANTLAQQGLDSTNIDIAKETVRQGGGIEGMAARNIRKADLAREATETNIAKGKSYMKYLDATAKGTMNKTPKNLTLEEQISDKDKEIKSILSSPTFLKDGDGESVNIEDLFTIDRVTGEMKESEEANSYASADIARLKDLVRDRFNLRLNQTTTIIDGNGNKREVTIAQKEEMIRKQLEEKELERQRRINEAQRQEKQAISASTLF